MRDCSYEVDTTFEELQKLDSLIDQLEEDPKLKQSFSHELELMEKRLNREKIPLSEKTRATFKETRQKTTSANYLVRFLLYDLLNNYCDCKSNKENENRQPM
jgi:hypothetical protein